MEWWSDGVVESLVRVAAKSPVAATVPVVVWFHRP
jgi:hypothetical protein